MNARCEECGAAREAGATCRASFDALLGLEWEIAGGPGEAAHFLAVSAYALQHPVSMNYTAAALAGARRNVADVLAGRASIAEILRRVRAAADGARRITRRAGEDAVRWPVAAWPVTVADVLRGGAAGYRARVERWAGSILAELDAASA